MMDAIERLQEVAADIVRRGDRESALVLAFALAKGIIEQTHMIARLARERLAELDALDSIDVHRTPATLDALAARVPPELAHLFAAPSPINITVIPIASPNTRIS